MDQIIPYPLWVGHAGDGRDYRSILDGGIRALLQVAVEEQALQPPSELIYLRFPILDGIDNPPDVLSLAVSTAAALIQAHVPTLVCCGAGMSRAPLMAAAGMALVGSYDKRMAERLGCRSERRQPGGIDSVIVGEKEAHGCSVLWIGRKIEGTG